VRSWQEIGGFCSHTSQLENPLVFIGLIGFNAKLGHWQDLPLVCGFCPGRSGTQTAPINAGRGGWDLSVSIEFLSLPVRTSVRSLTGEKIAPNSRVLSN
jgi:hypothetical protein